MSQNVDRDDMLMILVRQGTYGCALTRIGNAMGILGAGLVVWEPLKEKLGLSDGEYYGIMNGWDQLQSVVDPTWRVCFESHPIQHPESASDFSRGQELGKRLWKAVHP